MDHFLGTPWATKSERAFEKEYSMLGHSLHKSLRFIDLLSGDPHLAHQVEPSNWLFLQQVLQTNHFF